MKKQKAKHLLKRIIYDIEESEKYNGKLLKILKDISKINKRTFIKFDDV